MRAKAPMLVLAAAVSITPMALLAGCSEPPKEEPKADEQKVEEKAEDTIPIVYEHDELVNKYIVAFNAQNQDAQIVDPQPYNHNASTHYDQTHIEYDGFGVTISNHLYEKVEVYIECYKNKKTNDETKLMFIRFARPLFEDMDDDALSGIWDRLMDDGSTHFEDFDGTYVNLSVDVSDGNVDYLTIEGPVSE